MTDTSAEKRYKNTILEFGERIADLTVERAHSTMPRWVRPFIDSTVRHWVARLAAAIAVRELAETDHVSTYRLVISAVERMKEEA